jgi:hypothetical protein
VVAQQFNRLIDELPAMLGPCTLVAPSQLSQHLLSRPRTHRFVHVGDGNRTFGATTLSDPQSQPLAGNKHFGAIRVFTFPEKSIATVTVFPHFPALVWFGA